MDATGANNLANPREKANPFSVVFWCWTLRLFKKGYTKILTVEDLYNPLKKDHSTLLGDRLEKQWNVELQQAKKRKKQPNLLKTMFMAFRAEIFFMGFIHVMLEFVFRMCTPILLGYLLKYFRQKPETTTEEAFMFAGGLTVANFLTILSTNHLLFLAYHLGGRIRISVCSLVYRKALKLSKTALGETAPGKIVNLVANDVNRFELVMIFLHTMWSAPLSTLIIGYILYTQAHYAALIGIAVVLTVVPIQIYTGKLSSIYRLRTAIKTDERVRLMDEIISGVQVIKMYAWEKPFCALVELARRLELKVVRKSSYLRGLFMTFFLFTTRMALYCTIVSSIYFKESLTTDKIFVFASFYNLLSNSMSAMFVRGFAELAECKVSVSRIQSFLMLEEFDPENVTHSGAGADAADSAMSPVDVKFMAKDKADKGDDEKLAKSTSESVQIEDDRYAVTMNHVQAKWYPEKSDNTLDSINLKLEKGKLYAVIGMVGAGKSSLLSALLGEIKLVSGNVKVKGKISYVPQDAWVFNSSVRQNILFGQELDLQRYQRVVKACSLYKDFHQFPDGDQTIVGERGCSLSGGQKARINLARAVYRHADIYLLDDPLSAVDAHVGKHLFDQCIRRHLMGKTRILATHQLQFIKDVDGIILLDQGKIQFYDDYHQLLNVYPEYNSLIASDNPENPDEFNVEKVELRRRFSSTGSRGGSRVSISDGGGDSESEDVKDEEAKKFGDTIEGTSKGMVKGSVFLQYFRMGSSLFTTGLMAALFIVTQLCVSFNDYMVPYITSIEEARQERTTQNASNSSWSRPGDSYDDGYYTTEFYVYVYTGLVLSIFVIGLCRSFVYYGICMRASERLHNRAFYALMRTCMRFFDTNPSGRIINRFSKDTTATDEHLPKAMLDAGQVLLFIAGAMILTCIVNKIFLVPAAVIALVSWWIRRVFLKTSKNIKRLEGMTRSPVFTHLSATLNGISTIRAYQAQSILKLEFDKFQDVHTSSWYMFTATSMAYAFALDLFTFSFVTFITFSFLIFKEQFDSGSVGLAITQMMSIASLVQWGMRQSAEVTNQMMSVERILEYLQIAPEKNLRDQGQASQSKKSKNKPVLAKLLNVPAHWPSSGAVEFRNVYMRYAPEGEPVLRDLSFYIKASQKIGIVGRTGAGKSSLISAMFRLAEIDGIIEIDGVDTGNIAVEDLRSHISIIPQDPVLFSGTLRRNLDPFEEFEDEALWQALEQVELKDSVVSTGNGLDSRVLDRGANFSVGQRQLVCLARAILRNNKVLMLDEATANVDPQTDALIQTTIRTKFANCTVLTVAHRLNTIIDSDKVLVMDKGQVAEYDHPYKLLENNDSQFNSLVRETGDAMYQQLFNLAKQCYEEKYPDQQR
ncbi:probable multidrug resistance-associated protein lethal(2)03659 [Trichogramma pretiosum]|uniref:probable multidrug resistance-associated protein lethal(2)03659 n=1 Tax=Trichogramma pretiosum TaxID=7493 RepID=UPI0006C97079|nr:probable multidrug resistance-associated protein lethal(2)03659 [Trichogramma pretiosum]XP_023313504.1 probable multidrug resistance-associated protein lethal(2)03659 [Trichogramma pretiosum]